MSQFQPIVAAMKAKYDLRVRRWRSSMSGCAWRAHYDDGRAINWIESPYPKTPISLSIFLHEVGHHAIGFDKYDKGCEEEYHVWLWAINTMRKFGVQPDKKVMRRFEASMSYAVDKATRRGMCELPRALREFVAKAA
jgi:hypothetical protein